MINWFIKLRADRRGAAALEYGLMAALIAVVITTGVKTIGTNLSTAFTSIASSVAP